eukprot:scaffold63087_cov68-Phaeocystis_antarctica.AAC.3
MNTSSPCGHRGNGSVEGVPKWAFQMTITGQCHRYSGYEMRPRYRGTLRPSRALRLAKRHSFAFQLPLSPPRSGDESTGAPATMKQTPAATGRVPRTNSPADPGRSTRALAARSAVERSCSKGCIRPRSACAVWPADKAAVRKYVSAPARSCQALVGKL